jgi:hypothetical protein
MLWAEFAAARKRIKQKTSVNVAFFILISSLCPVDRTGKVIRFDLGSDATVWKIFGSQIFPVLYFDPVHAGGANAGRLIRVIQRLLDSHIFPAPPADDDHARPP